MNLRQMEIVIYKEHLKVDIQETCKKYKTIKQWAYILHDKDDTGPHYHIYLNFSPSSCDSKMVAKWFNLGYQYHRPIAVDQGNIRNLIAIKIDKELVSS